MSCLSTSIHLYIYTSTEQARPPISLDFKVPMFSASGVNVRFLKVYEKSNYKTVRWVRYLSKAGEYEVRI